ncbi:MAG: hypothetical protein ACYTEK_11625 [Planctomycetota bacterium]|jgi:hypothetical protein
MEKLSLIIISVAVLIRSAGCEKKPTARTDEEITPSASEGESNDSDAAFSPWWAFKKGYCTTKGQIVVSQYTDIRIRKPLRLETELAVATFDIRDVIEELGGTHSFDHEWAMDESPGEEDDNRTQDQYNEFSGRERARVNYCLAALLEQGKFIITLRSNGQVVSEIIAREWADVSPPSQAVGGRVFCLKDGSVLFRFTDWIT